MKKSKASPNGYVAPAKIKGVMGKKGSIHKKLGMKPNAKIPKSKFEAMAKSGNKAAKLTLLLNKNKKGW
jgi:hypothetical protein